MRPGGCRDEPRPAAEVPDLRQWDAAPLELSASDALGGALQDVAPGADHRLPALPAVADVGKSAGQARGGRAPGARFLPSRRSGPLERPDAAEELCTRAGDQSAERSCEAPEGAVPPQPAESLGVEQGAQTEPQVVARTLRSAVMRAQTVSPPPQEVQGMQPDVEAERPEPAELQPQPACRQ